VRFARRHERLRLRRRPGNKLDGNAFIDDAIRRGASAIVSERKSPTARSPSSAFDCAREALAELAIRFHRATPPRT